MKSIFVRFTNRDYRWLKKKKKESNLTWTKFILTEVKSERR